MMVVVLPPAVDHGVRILSDLVPHEREEADRVRDVGGILDDGARIDDRSRRFANIIMYACETPSTCTPW